MNLADPRERRWDVRQVDLVRGSDWWNDKIPHLIAIVAICAAAMEPPAARTIRDLVLFVASAVGIAAFGHVVNDLADVDDDRQAGKVNRIGELGRSSQALLVVACSVLGAIPWIWLPRSSLAAALLSAEVLLLLAYSLPPLRLKRRAALGVCADAAYAYVLPVLLTLTVFGPPPASWPWWTVALLSAHGLMSGVRGIVWHQVIDAENDRASGVATLVQRVGEVRALRAIDRVAPIEAVVLAVLVLAAARFATSPAIAIACALYLPWRLFQVQYVWDPPLVLGNRRTPGAVSKLVGYGISLGVLERWLPIVALVVASVRQPLWWVVTAVVAVSFRSALSEIATLDVGSFVAGFGRLAAIGPARRVAHRVRSERVASLGEPVSERTSTDRDSRGWVFVLCGSAVHTGALRTAVRHLRERSELPIWVVTDSTRNEERIDPAGIAEVVDVRAPSELDHHEAAIWLKTSAHRHLPIGEWCYLDTDIVAVAPGVDELFEHRVGPVAFASDLPIPANTVDHFSPFAMTCACRIDGIERCTHLRDELRTRLGLDVPGDWCHWNGGVFAFGPEAAPVLDRWHELAVASFDWPEWRTRDQGALIATVWEQGLVDLPRLPQEFNLIVADPWRNDVHIDPDRGWSLGPDGPWLRPRLLHLFQSGLDDPTFDVGRDVERPIVRRSVAARRFRLDLRRWWSDHVAQRFWKLRGWMLTAAHRMYWSARKRFELTRYRARRLVRRLHPTRIRAALRRRFR